MGDHPWTEDDTALLRRISEADLSACALDWYEEAAEAVQAFCCFVFGSLMGMRDAGTTDEADFRLVWAHLAAFTLDRSEAIHAVYTGSGCSTG
jgi:alpha/beta superfamily hydrolase